MHQEEAAIDVRKVSTTHNEGAIAPSGLGYRHLQVLLLFSGLAIAYSLRVNLSVAIVAMTSRDDTNGEVFDWDESIQGLILSSFFWGYAIAQVPASQLALYFGAKPMLFVAGIGSALLTIITPWVASYSWTALLATRMIMGLFQGVYFPCTHMVLSKWAHPMERGRLASVTYSGANIGTVLMLAVSGLIASSFMGWPGIFYCSGTVCLLWAFALLAYLANAPANCAQISPEERSFIESMPGSAIGGNLSVPWKEIFTSKAVIALIIVHSTQNWGYWTLLTEIPSYLKQVFGFNIKTNALLSSLPYMVLWVLTLIFSPLSDWLVNRGYISVSIARKLFNTIGHWVPMVTLIALAYVTNTTLAMVLLTTAVGMSAGTNVGFLVNHIDLSPNFAGSLMAITNSISNVWSMIAPIVAGMILNRKLDDDQDKMSNWKMVFFIAAGFYLVGNLIFIIFGRGKIQPWNEPKKNDADR